MDAGYSKTTLLKKLGIKDGYKVWLLDVPTEYLDWLGPLPDIELIVGTRRRPKKCDFVHCFSTQQKLMHKHLFRAKEAMSKSGMLWLSWPKKASGVDTDLDGNAIREMGLATGLVDVKVAAVSEVWSGHKFVFRKSDR